MSPRRELLCNVLAAVVILAAWTVIGAILLVWALLLTMP